MIISVLGREVPIQRVSATDLAKIAEDNDCLGLFQDNQIYLSSGLSKEDEKRVLMHEITHAVLTYSGLSNLLDEKLEEAICDAMETLHANFCL